MDDGAGEHTVLKGHMLCSFSMAKDKIWHKSPFSLTLHCRPCQSNHCICVYADTGSILE